MKFEFLKSNIKSGDHRRIGRKQIWIGIILILVGLIRHLLPLSTYSSRYSPGTIVNNLLTFFDTKGNHAGSIFLYSIGGIFIIFGIINRRKKFFINK